MASFKQLVGMMLWVPVYTYYILVANIMGRIVKPETH